MLDQSHPIPEPAQEFLGDLTALAEQLGGTESLSELPMAAGQLASGKIESLADLEGFLAEYTTNLLVRHELPAVYRSHHLATQGHARELIGFDQELRSVLALDGFARASAHVARMQLRRLRPLRTERVIQRYAQAVESGTAHGWHTLVFGLVLGVYSLPLRQGLIHFGCQTLAWFVHAGGRRLKLDAAARENLLSAQSAPVKIAVEEMLARSPFLADVSRAELSPG